jgi:exo-beta-1,3-glucanase (GH17 family)/cellulose synthase/poly-beta-1,6-N-acetylglucosamine synthase-like glycosyltransferase
MGTLTVLLWALVNQPDIEPPWPDEIDGFCFSPGHSAVGPAGNSYPTVEEIIQDLQLLSGDARAIRTYTVAETLAEIPRLAATFDFNVALGAWISDDEAANGEEIEKLIRVYRENHRSVVRVIVGNEVLLRGERSVEQMIDYIKKVKGSVWAPVSLAEPWHVWLENPRLVEAVDYIAVHLLPYWEGIPLESAVDYVVMRYEQLEEAYPGKEIVIAEVGWPSFGRTRQGAVASRANQATFLRRFLQMANENDYTYYIMEAFDQLWKTTLEGEAGSHWGVYNTRREAKFEFTNPVVNIPEWRGLSAIAIVIAILLLALLFRDSSGLRPRGRGFLALIAYGIATFSVWMVYQFSQHYMTPSTLVVGVVLFLFALGVIIVLLAEAHEWAEALWLAEPRRPRVTSRIEDDDLPLVSIHVPAYNEPPQMLIETLDALAKLDYPRFEVLVIDNNTRDPAVWQPVEEHCASLGERFRFFHLLPLEGFKAGALNFALQNTAAEAQVVAVIDSDYQVSPQWLRSLVPNFSSPEIAIVQAPQDYRDGNVNAFKAMCLAEYHGFFHIGMVTRDQRNAIIQHGTMTLVRRAVLDDVGGWAEWCITEDAELGLRIFEQGYAATYVPRSYGKGLMPDTFTDYKKQRFRWAYGAVLIMREHLAVLLGLEKSHLSRGQRYHFIAGWLPWFADGLNLIFNFAALGWSVAMIWYPQYVAPPHMIFMVLPAALFAFKILKMLVLYYRGIGATLRQSIAAGVAGLSLSHVIARAMLAGFFTRKIGFFRTPKRASSNALLRALLGAREELLFLVALLLAAVMVLSRDDGDLLDVQFWALVLCLQSVNYMAAVLVSLISGMPWLPAKLVGTMADIEVTDAAKKMRNSKSGSR